MRFLLVAKTGPPFPNRENIRPWYLAKILAKKGHEVHFLFPSERSFNQKKEGISLHGSNILVKGPWWLQKILFSFLGIFRAIQLILEYNIDWIQGWNFPPTFIATISAKITGKKSLVDMTDFGFDLMGSGRILPNIIVQIIKFLEVEFIPKLADHVVVVSESMRGKLVRFGVKSDKMSIISEGVDLKQLEKIKGKKRGNYMLYVGNVEYFDGVDLIIEAFRKIKSRFKGLKLVIVGGGRKYFEQLKIKQQSEDIIFTGFISRKEVAKYIKGSKICVIGFRKTLHTDSIVSLKLLEYWTFGKPVIAPNLKTIGELIKEYSSGIIFKVEDAQDLSGNMLKLLTDKRLGKKLGENSKRAVKDFDLDTLFKDFIPIYET